MAKRKNLSEQLSEYSADSENLSGTNFAIHKNVMVWGGTIIQLSNISSISQYNSWENKDENYYEQVERTVSFKEIMRRNRPFKLMVWGTGVSLIIGLAMPLFFIVFIVLAILTAYFYYKQRKENIDVPQIKKNRICHYMICIIMNSTRKYNFEIQTEAFRNKVMLTLYQRIVEPGSNANDIQIDLKNCNIVTDSVVNGGQVLLGDENENHVEYPDETEE